MAAFAVEQQVPAHFALLDSDPLSWLTQQSKDSNDSTSKQFLSAYWEKKPHVFKATPARKEYFEGLCTRSSALAVIEALEGSEDAVHWGVDVNAARYVEGNRETVNGDGEVSYAEAKHLYEDLGCTLQVHQPQRWDIRIWRIISSLEAQLGCLVGCNSYITPGGTQGLAPHYDDVDVFVCQTEGSKRWQVYDSSASGEAGYLCTSSSKDLPAEGLPTPLLGVVLEVGDVLYMPRGTIHQAQAPEGAPSKKNTNSDKKSTKKGAKSAAKGAENAENASEKTGCSHLTFSAYQRWNLASLAQVMLGAMMDNLPRGLEGPPVTLPRALRQGLPVGFLYNFGYEASLKRQGASAANGVAVPGTPQPKAKNGKKGAGAKKGPSAAGAPSDAGLQRQLAAALAGGLRELADMVESQPEMLDVAADVAAYEFMKHRAPPHPEQLREQEDPPEGPNARLLPAAPAYLHATRINPCAEKPKPSAGPCVRLLSIIDNDISTHMMGPSQRPHEGPHEGPHVQDGTCCGMFDGAMDRLTDDDMLGSDDEDAEEDVGKLLRLRRGLLAAGRTDSDSDEQAGSDEETHLLRVKNKRKGDAAEQNGDAQEGHKHGKKAKKSADGAAKTGNGVQQEPSGYMSDSEEEGAPDLVPAGAPGGPHAEIMDLGESDMESDEESDDEGGLGGDLVFQEGHVAMLQQILNAQNGVAVKSIKVPEGLSKEDVAEAQMEVANVLFSEGLVVAVEQ